MTPRVRRAPLPAGLASHLLKTHSGAECRFAAARSVIFREVRNSTESQGNDDVDSSAGESRRGLASTHLEQRAPDRRDPAKRSLTFSASTDTTVASTRTPVGTTTEPGFFARAPVRPSGLAVSPRGLATALAGRFSSRTPRRRQADARLSTLLQDGPEPQQRSHDACRRPRRANALGHCADGRSRHVERCARKRDGLSRLAERRIRQA
jgi:hypothetical protein